MTNSYGEAPWLRKVNKEGKEVKEKEKEGKEIKDKEGKEIKDKEGKESKDKDGKEVSKESKDSLAEKGYKAEKDYKEKNEIKEKSEGKESKEKEFEKGGGKELSLEKDPDYKQPGDKEGPDVDLAALGGGHPSWFGAAPQGYGGVASATGSVEARLWRLEQSVAALWSHFIEPSERPPLGTSALRREEDLSDDAVDGERQDGPADAEDPEEGGAR